MAITKIKPNMTKNFNSSKIILPHIVITGPRDFVVCSNIICFIVDKIIIIENSKLKLKDKALPLDIINSF